MAQGGGRLQPQACCLEPLHVSVLTGAIPIVTLEREGGRERECKKCISLCCQILQSLENKFLNFGLLQRILVLVLYTYVVCMYVHAVNRVTWWLCLCCVAMHVSELLNYAWETRGKNCPPF